ncbi:hypothetical protein ABFX02_11G024800 [Erythranthe guttata]
MDAPAALGFDPSKCGKLSMEQKRELVYEVCKWPDSAAEMLQAWTRTEILQLLCAELGKERKYTGLTKSKIIENLLKIVNEKKSNEDVSELQPSLENGERTPKRQRKSDQSNRPIAAECVDDAPDVDLDNPVYCKNSACKAKLNVQDLFCKRCSCCICRNYDDNKDPSLWLICNSDPPFHGVSCGMSCHLECALRHENSGISQDRQDKGLDGSFCCVSCGKVNDLLSFWRKQLVVARDTRRVDILCYRLSLAQKILTGTKHYQNLYRIIDEAVKKLEQDFGPLTGLPVKKARGIVNRLPSGPEIQRLCASAVESLDLMLSNRVSDIPSSDCIALASKLVRFEDISPATNCSTLSNPSSVEDETKEEENRADNYLPSCDADKTATANLTISNGDDFLNPDIKESSNDRTVEDSPTGLECVPYVSPIITPSKDGCGRSKNRPKCGGNSKDKEEEERRDGSSSKKRSGEEEGCGVSNGGIGDKDFEYYVKMVRRLECEGHIETSFRRKFLTWFGLRANSREVRVVKVFIDTFVEDSESLAGQLVDAFSDVVVSDKRCSAVPAGFCMKLWH